MISSSEVQLERILRAGSAVTQSTLLADPYDYGPSLPQPFYPCDSIIYYI